MTQAQNVAIESSQINSSGVLLTTGGGTGLSTVGTNGQVLTSNGTTLSWVTPTTTSPGGSNTQIQFNSSGSFGGSANLTWDGSALTVTGVNTTSLISTAGFRLGGYLSTGSYGYYLNSGISGNIAYIQSLNNTATNDLSLDGSTIRFRAGTFTEAMRIDSAGNVLIGTTTTNRGNFTNNKLSAVISADNYATWSITNTSNAVNNTTVTALRFLDAAGNLTGGSGMAGTLFVRTTGGSGANQYLAHYSLLSGGNGTTDAGLTLLASRTRGTTPISSVNIANDGGGGAIQITITWANNSGVVTGGSAVVSFVGISI